MRVHSAVIGSLLLVGLAAGACGGGTVSGGPGPLDDAGADGSTNPEAGVVDDVDVPLVPASKIDILLVVDNSASMADKSEKLAASVGSLIKAVSDLGDLHIGVVSSSLGSFGGDV